MNCTRNSTNTSLSFLAGRTLSRRTFGYSFQNNTAQQYQRLLQRQVQQQYQDQHRRWFAVFATSKYDPRTCQFMNQEEKMVPFIQQHPIMHVQVPIRGVINQNNTPRLVESQVRYRRHDRSSAFSKPRPKTRKQRQAYNRRMKKIVEAKERNSPPGSRAGPARQFAKEQWQELLNYGKGKDLVETEPDETYGLDNMLVEGLLAKSSFLASQPTPVPVHLGHVQPQLFHKVVKKMTLYRQHNSNNKLLEGGQPTHTEEHLPAPAVTPTLPTDGEISTALRAYRDRFGTRSRPIGVVKALQHLLKDMQLPTSVFGEKTYTTLLTCCGTPKEVCANIYLTLQSESV